MFKRLRILPALIGLTGTFLYSADETILNGMADKGTHGFVNLVYCGVEMPMQIYKTYDRSQYWIEEKPALSRLSGICWGMGRGVIFMTGRAYLGIYQLTGFWAADPDNNDGIGIPLDGEYPMDYGLMHAYTLNNIHVPILAKFKRGISNIRWMFQDFPKNIWLVTRDDVPKVSYGKSLWFAASRFWSGFHDISGCFLPSAQETEGYSFEPKFGDIKKDVKDDE